MKYAALLRGIGPGNPNMHGAKLRGFFEDLGFSDVQSVISSGNVVFESPKRDVSALETKIEKALPAKLSFSSTTIIRSREELQKLADSAPFGKLEHGRQSYLMVTFFKHPTVVKFSLPYKPPGKPYELLTVKDKALMTVTDNTQVGTTDLMTWLERQFGKEITSRTWLTVRRILKKMG